MLNAYALAVLAALVVDYLISTAARLLDLRAMTPEPPPELAAAIDREAYRRSQEYTRARTRFALVVEALALAALLVFWFAGGFAALDVWVRGFGYGPVVTGVVYIGSLLLLKALLDLPADLWSTFVLEERFGFNRTTLGTFVADRLKGLALALVLGAPLLALVLVVFLRLGDDLAWLVVWAVAALVVVLLQLIVPTWILPLFHRFSPLPEGALRTAIERYAGHVGFELGGIAVIDGSRRSNRANAFFTGFGKGRRVALFDTLVDAHDDAEVVTVVAHEIGHYRLRHIPKMLLLGLAHQGVVLYLLSLFLAHPGLYAAFGVSEPSLHTGLVFFLLLVSPIELVLAFLLNALSRRHEYEADRYAVDTVAAAGLADPAALAAALERLAADNLANLTPHPFSVALRHSHPPVARRVAAIRRRVAELRQPVTTRSAPPSGAVAFEV